MTATEPQVQVELFSKEWCAEACKLWERVVIPNLVDLENYNYIAEWGVTDTGAVCQFKAEKGQILSWEPGKRFDDDACDFILWAKVAAWKQVGEGKMDPVGAVASKRIHLRKGPMPVVIKEADAFKRLLIGYGEIPTAW